MRRISPIQWLVCAVAAVGFAFDIYEILMMPLIVRPLLIDLGGLRAGSPGFNGWAGAVFYLPALAGGIFGLLGGYLADLIGRRRILVWSILLYGIAACGAGLSTSLPMFLALRCLTFVGVAVEYVVALTWVAELFPDPKQREAALGYTQAAAGIGGLLVTGAYFVAVTYGDRLPAIAGGHQAWRYMLISGLLPALPLMLVRPWLPDSPVWVARRPRLRNLFAPDLRLVTWLTLIMVACAYAAAYGGLQQLPRVVAGLPSLSGSSPAAREQTITSVQLVQELGHLAGRYVFALVAIGIARQRRLLRIFQWPGLLAFALLFFIVPAYTPHLLHAATFITSFFVVAQFSFWGNYLPRLYPTHIRATGESFATNVGGRIIGIFAAVVTTQAANVAPGMNASLQLAHAAGAVALVAYVVAVIATAWLPEPRGAALPA